MNKTTKTILASNVIDWYAPDIRKDANEQTSKLLRAFTGNKRGDDREIYRIDGHSDYGDDVSLVVGRTTWVSPESLEKNYRPVAAPEWATPKPPEPAPVARPEPTMADVMAEIQAIKKIMASADARGQLSLLGRS